MSWETLRTYRGMPFTLRPISTWLGDMPATQRPSLFKATLAQTLRQLKGELEHLAAHQVVIEMAYEEGALIRDAGGDVREALKATHPDRGGNPTDFRSVQLARDSDA